MSRPAADARLLSIDLLRGAVVVRPWSSADHPIGNPPAPEGYRWGLPLLDRMWGPAALALYPACRWFADLKARWGGGWLRFR